MKIIEGNGMQYILDYQRSWDNVHDREYHNHRRADREWIWANKHEYLQKFSSDCNSIDIHANLNQQNTGFGGGIFGSI